MQSKAATVEQYLAELPEDRRAALQTLRRVFLENLRGGYEEGMHYGGVCYCVPHSLYPAGYHCDPKQPLPFAGFGWQKHGISVGLFCLYSNPGAMARFQRAWRATGKRLDMGKSCVRFRKIEDAPLEVLAETIRSVPVDVFIRHYEAAIRTKNARASGRAAGPAAKKAAAKRPAKTAKATNATKGKSSKAAPKHKAARKPAQ